MAALLAVLLATAPPPSPSPPQPSVFNSPISGANLINEVETEARLRAAATAGIRVVRLAPDRWKSAQRNFLIGDTDRYTGLVPEDLAKLTSVLNAADRAGLKVILTLLNAPGSRSPRGAERPDARLWQYEAYHDQTVQLWQDLASALANHPAVIAFDPLNEPQPLRAVHELTDPTSAEFAAKISSTRGTPLDSDSLYLRVIRAIRKSTRSIPVVVESVAGASPYAFRYLRHQADPGVFYSFHAFEPKDYVNFAANGGRYHYPAKMPGPSQTTVAWDRHKLAAQFDDVAAFQRRYKIDSRRIVVGEYGASRRVAGVVGYMSHLTGVFHTRGWHRLFDRFRGDTAPEFDYELGTLPKSTTRSNNSLWKTLTADLERSRAK